MSLREEEKAHENPLIDGGEGSSAHGGRQRSGSPSGRPRFRSMEQRRQGGLRFTNPELKKSEKAPGKDKQGAVGALEEGFVKGAMSSLGGPVGGGFSAIKTFFSSKKKTFSATVISLAFVFIAFVGWGIISGPLKIISFGQNLISNHLGDHEDASDGRLSRMYRYFSNGNDPGETRINYFESKYKGRMISQLREVGLEPVFSDGQRVYEGFDVDTTNRNSRFYGMSEAQIKEEVGRRGFTATETFSGGNGRIRVFVSGTLNQKVSIRVLLQELGYNRLTAAIRARPIEKYGWVTWHPLSPIDKKLDDTFRSLYRKYKEKRDERRQSKTNGNNIDTTNAREQTPDPDDGDSPIPGGKSGEPDVEETKETLDKLRGSKTLKLTGALAATSGVVCGVRQLNDSWNDINFKQVFEVAIRVGMDIITIAQQAMSGDIDLTTIGLASRELDERDDNGKVVSTINSAKTYKEDTGGTGGQDLDSEEKQLFYQKVPGYLSWAADSTFDPICSTAGQAAAGIIDVAVGVISGGTATTLGGLVAGALVGDKVMDVIANLLAGQALNVADASGAKLANIASYGARAAGSGIAQQSGANILSGSEEKNLRLARLENDSQELENKGLAYKLFNPYDPHTLAGKTVASLPSSTNLMPDIAAGASNIFSDILSLPFKFFSSIVSAQTPNDGYDYPFSKYGFSLSDLNNPLFENPFDNAKKAGKILDSSSGDKYIDRALDCYGVKISKGPNGWDTKSEKTVPDSYDEKAYKDKKCADQNTKWKRVRFFILDSGVLTAWACLQDDEEACTDLFGANAPTAGGGSGPDVTVSAGGFEIKKFSPALNSPGGKISPKGITLHWWGTDSGGRGINALADALRGNTSCGEGGCSVQFGITNDGEIYQMTSKENDLTYHAIGGNETTFGIEMEGGPEDFGRAGKQKYPKKFQAAVFLVKYLVDKYGISINGSTACNNVRGIHPHKAYNHCGETKTDIDNYYFQEIIKAVKNG